jgi:hypothetical protein
VDGAGEETGKGGQRPPPGRGVGLAGSATDKEGEGSVARRRPVVGRVSRPWRRGVARQPACQWQEEGDMFDFFLRRGMGRCVRSGSW